LISQNAAASSASAALISENAAASSASAALISQNAAASSANAAAASAAASAQVGTSTLLTGFSTGANTTILGTDTILGAFQKAQGQINARVSGTGVAGQVAFWSGTGSQSGDSKLIFNSSTGLLTLDGDLTLTGAQTIQTSTGNLTLATGAGNGNVVLSAHGTGCIDTANYFQARGGLTNIAFGASPLDLGPILTFTLTNGGSGYVDGTYTDVVLTLTGSQAYALFDITVTGGIVTSATLKFGGQRYVAGNTYTIANTLLGGSGSGLIITVNTVQGADQYFTNASGTTIRLERNSTAILADQIYGQILFGGRDSSAFASGDRAGLISKSIGLTGGSYFDLEVSNASVANRVIGLRVRHDSARFLDGTASVPAISFLNDTNTGIYSAGADLLGFSTGGSERGRFSTTGNFLLNTTTDAGFRLDVNGTARVQGALTTNLTAGRVPFIGTGGVLSDDSGLTWNNTTKSLGIGVGSGTVSGYDIEVLKSTTARIISKTSSSSSYSSFEAQNELNNAVAVIQRGSASTGTTLGVSNANASQIYTVGTPLVIGTFNNFDLNFGTTSSLRWSILGAGGILQSNGSQTIRSSTGNLTIATNGGNGNIILNPNGTGVISITDDKNLSFGTTTGTRLGTATNQRLSLWNATPNVQPTTAITAGAFVANTSGIANDTATFDGYTMGQVVAALRRIGALA
jgi:hypothetical protein